MILGVDLDSDGFERCNAQQRFGIILTEDYGRADHLAHEFNLRDADIRFLKFSSVSGRPAL